MYYIGGAMRNVLTVFLFFYCFTAYSQDIDDQLDELFLENVDDVNPINPDENTAHVTQWGKDETFSSFVHMKDRLKSSNSPLFIFVIDGGDLFEAENLSKFLNSSQGKSFRTFANYFVVNQKSLALSKTLKKKLNPDGNMFMMNHNLELLAHCKIDFYKTKTGDDWWKRLKKFASNNKDAVNKASEYLRNKSDAMLIARFDDAIDKIKHASFKQRKKAIRDMKSLVKQLGFLLFPVTNEKDPEASDTAEKLLLGNQTGLNFPVTKKVPSWFDFDKQVAGMTIK